MRVLLVFLFALFAPTEPPPLPSSFYGVVLDVAADPERRVTAEVRGVQCGSSPLVSWEGETWYALDCLGDILETEPIEGGRPGDTVVLWLDGGPIGGVGVWQSGVNVRRDLMLPNAVRLLSFTAHSP